MSSDRDRDALADRVRRYYRTVSRYIDREHLHDESRRFWRRIAREAESGSAILELGCGTGRVTTALSDGARTVVGVDLSPEMLARARDRLGHRARVHLLRADMRRLPLDGVFGLVTAAGDPFVHLDADADRDRAFYEAARLLAPGGRFVLELHWLCPERLAEAGRPGGYTRCRTIAPDGEELRVRETWRCDDETRRCTARYEYLRDDRIVDEASFRARLWSLAELRRRLVRAGFEARELWGGFDRSPFDPAASTRLLVDARTRESEA